LEDLERAQQKAADLTTFKAELLAKVEEHVDDLDRSLCKRDEVAKFKKEVLDKVVPTSDGGAAAAPVEATA
jgi:Tfp pilus assembly protein PilO